MKRKADITVPYDVQFSRQISIDQLQEIPPRGKYIYYNIPSKEVTNEKRHSGLKETGGLINYRHVIVALFSLAAIAGYIFSCIVSLLVANYEHS